MILDLLKDAEKTWREIVKLAKPIDSEKEVVVTSQHKPKADIEAWTDNKKIYINVGDEKKLWQSFEKIIIPEYKASASMLYDIQNPVSDLELMTSLLFDTFLFVHFHEQLHPWLCPNSRTDEKKITKALYEGILKAEPKLSKAQAMCKANNCKNLVWDVVLNTSFISKVYSDNILSEKVSFIFEKEGRKIEFQPVKKYPLGIVPILYMTSAKNNTTDVPISLAGMLYTSMSYNEPDVREKVAKIFLDDLDKKSLPETQVLNLLEKMYQGFISEINPDELKARNIDLIGYAKKASTITDFKNHDYKACQEYLANALTKIFDTPSMRYDSLKGFATVISKYVSLDEKQGSPDKNTSSYGDEGQGSASQPCDKSEDELEQGSMSQTLDDLIETLDGKEADSLMGDVANGSHGAGMLPKKIIDNISVQAADEYYKKNADIIEMHNPSQENVSVELGSRKRWKLVRTRTLTAVEASKLNYNQILSFQKSTSLPVLVDVGNGYYKLNEYKLEETPLKSYNSELTGIEIPDNWVLFQDSSGSMASRSYVGSKDKFDILNRVKYGIKKGLYQLCKELGKDLRFGVVDFSDATVYKGLDSLTKVYESKSHPIKTVSLTPQCGGTQCDYKVFKKIEKELYPGKTVYTFITDGQIDGDIISLYYEIEQFASKENNAFVFIEVDSKSSFGEDVKRLSKANPSVIYHAVKNVKDIKDKLSSVLIKYGK
ncbi:hypothetical protein FJZ53_02865 [Candidatus Woesearchaeota archaeon]|nr:hypothetical protein [Candidatus Woesearchaeota archaeon]